MLKQENETIVVVWNIGKFAFFVVEIQLQRYKLSVYLRN